MTALKPTRVPLPAGCVGFIAQDPADGRWLWAVRWGRDVKRGRLEWRWRNGKADTELQARTSLVVAYNQGRPAIDPL